VAKLQVKTTDDFDLLNLFDKLSQFDESLGKPKKISENSVIFDVNKDYDFIVQGDFNAKQTDGDVSKVTFYFKSKPVLEITDTEFSLKDIIILAKHGSELVMGSFLTEENYIYGNKGDDVLFNLAETHFFGGKGDDLFIDNIALNNHYDGETGNDIVAYRGNTTTQLGIVASLVDQSINTEEAAGDTYRSIEGLAGTQYDDTLYGSKKKNILSGMDGNDTLVGGAGGDDLDGGKGKDFASYADATPVDGFGVYASLEDAKSNQGDAKGDIYLGIEGLIGSSGNDVLIGNRRANEIFGGTGDDMIDGGRGNDTLWGDTREFTGFSGADTFRFTGLNNGVKTIMDFDNVDMIMITRKGFGLSNGFALVDGETFISATGAAATTADATFLYDRETRELSFDADGTGSDSAEVIAKLNFDVQEYLDINDLLIA
jgi:Ca2+-binding RTX toxin-like protein